MSYNGKAYTIIFKWQYDNNPNHFLIYEENSIIHANLNRLDQRKRLEYCKSFDLLSEADFYNIVNINISIFYK